MYMHMFSREECNGSIAFCFEPIDNGDPRWPPIKQKMYLTFYRIDVAAWFWCLHIGVRMR